jgi:hypothetical protein
LLQHATWGCAKWNCSNKLFALVAVGGLVAIYIVPLCREFYRGSIEPRLIPRHDIEVIADDIIDSFAGPEREAYLQREEAMWRSEHGGSVYWKRVSRAVERRKAGREAGGEAGALSD